MRASPIVYEHSRCATRTPNACDICSIVVSHVSFAVVDGAIFAYCINPSAELDGGAGTGITAKRMHRAPRCVSYGHTDTNTDILCDVRTPNHLWESLCTPRVCRRHDVIEYTAGAFVVVSFIHIRRMNSRAECANGITRNYVRIMRPVSASHVRLHTHICLHVAIRQSDYAHAKNDGHGPSNLSIYLTEANCQLLRAKQYGRRLICSERGKCNRIPQMCMYACLACRMCAAKQIVRVIVVCALKAYFTWYDSDQCTMFFIIIFLSGAAVCSDTASSHQFFTATSSAMLTVSPRFTFIHSIADRNYTLCGTVCPSYRIHIST